MTLLAFEHVTKSYRRGLREQTILDDVSLSIDPGELVAIWGQRRSGRTTLLRLAAGVESPDCGVVSFDGRNLATRGGEALGSGIGYCRRTFHGAETGTVIDELMVAQLARGVPPSPAREHAHMALRRTGAEHCAALSMRDLDGAEAVRVMLARALVPEPSVLVIDEPANGVDLLDRDAILTLLRSLADDGYSAATTPAARHNGIAILISAGETTELSVADRALSLSDGQLHGSPTPTLAPVVQLRRSASA